MRSTLLASLGALALTAAAGLSACRDVPTAELPAPVDPTVTEGPPASAPPARDESPVACATLREVESADVLRVGKDRVLYAHETLGLGIFNLGATEAPALLGVSPFVGTPLAVFDRGDYAIVAFVDWDSRASGPGSYASTVVRAVSLDDLRSPTTIGEVVLRGRARDVHRLGDAIVVTRDAPPGFPESADATVVTSLAVVGGKLGVRDEIALRGRGAVTGASAIALAVARPAPPAMGPGRTAVTWIEVSSESLGSLRPRETAAVNGFVAPTRSAAEGAIDVDDGMRVRLVMCATSECTPGEAATYAAVEFAAPERPRVSSWSLIGGAGADGVVRFENDRMFVARHVEGAADATEVVVFKTEPALETESTVRLQGTVASLVPRGPDLVALGWTGDATSGRRAVLHHVDLRRAGTARLVGSVGFGGDWTWTPAYDDERALSFEPSSTLAALPMTTWSDSSRSPTSLVQVFAFGPGGPQLVGARQTETTSERLFFADGRLFAFGDTGVLAVDYGRDAPSLLRRSWEDLRVPAR